MLSLPRRDCPCRRKFILIVSPNAQFQKLGYEAIGDTPEEASARIKSEVVRWTKIIRDAGVQPQ